MRIRTENFNSLHFFSEKEERELAPGHPPAPAPTVHLRPGAMKPELLSKHIGGVEERGGHQRSGRQGNGLGGEA